VAKSSNKERVADWRKRKRKEGGHSISVFLSSQNKSFLNLFCIENGLNQEDAINKILDDMRKK